MDRLWFRPDLVGSQMLVAIALADTAGDDGTCWPSVEHIAKKCSVSERTAQTCIKHLQSIGILRVYQRRDRSSIYAFQLEKMAKVERPKAGPKEKSPIDLTGANIVNPDEGTGANIAGTGADFVDDGCKSRTQNRHRTVNEPSDSPLTPKGEDGVERDLLGDPIISPEEQKALQEEHLLNFVMAGWNDLASRNERLSRIEKISETRKSSILARTEDFRIDGRTDEQLWTQVFANIEAWPFMLGLVKDWNIDFDYMVRKSKFPKLLEGRNTNGYGANDTFDRDTGRKTDPVRNAIRSASLSVFGGEHGAVERGNQGQTDRQATGAPRARPMLRDGDGAAVTIEGTAVRRDQR